MEIGESVAAPSQAPEESEEDSSTPITVLVVDEIGEPLKNTAVTVVSAGHSIDLTTDDEGKIRPELEEGTPFSILVGEAHEAVVADGQTSSGQHYAPGQEGPLRQD